MCPLFTYTAKHPLLSPEVRKSGVLNPIPTGLFEGGSAFGGGGRGRKVPAAYNSKTVDDNEMKFGRVVKDH